MAAGEPKRPDEDRAKRQRARLAAWGQISGAALAIVTLTCSLLGVISAQQAVAIGLLAVLLIVGGLITAATLDPSDVGRLGFRAGLHVGALMRQLRSVFRHR